MIYHVNPKKRAVVCRMPSYNNETHQYLYEEACKQALAKMTRYMKSNDNEANAWLLPEMFMFVFKKYMGNTEYYGIARCHPNDNFDENKGKEIARSKALYSYYKDMEKCMREIGKILKRLKTLALVQEDEFFKYTERLAIKLEIFNVK